MSADPNRKLKDATLDDLNWLASQLLTPASYEAWKSLDDWALVSKPMLEAVQRDGTVGWMPAPFAYAFNPRTAELKLLDVPQPQRQMIEPAKLELKPR